MYVMTAAVSNNASANFILDAFYDADVKLKDYL